MCSLDVELQQSAARKVASSPRRFFALGVAAGCLACAGLALLAVLGHSFASTTGLHQDIETAFVSLGLLRTGSTSRQPGHEESARVVSMQAQPVGDSTSSAGCTGSSDLATICKTFGILQSNVQGCAFKCIISGTSCMQSCAQNLGFTSTCSSCWVNLAACTKSKCILRCIDPKSSSCTACARSKCFPELLACSGLSCKQLPGCESESSKANIPACTSSSLIAQTI